ncbi:spermidine putrescine ABC transporter permease component PotB [Bacillus sp. JCM 19045]|nr:spermidine putrescine ABC transporter permease component PotB [Bacillus sp. JCM 19045]
MKRSGRYFLLLPGLLFLSIFMIIPLVLTISSTFIEDSRFTFAGYMSFLTDAYFLDILTTTLFVALTTTFFCIVLAFPVAYYISKINGSKKRFCSCWRSFLYSSVRSSARLAG